MNIAEQVADTEVEEQKEAAAMLPDSLAAPEEHTVVPVVEVVAVAVHTSALAVPLDPLASEYGTSLERSPAE